MIMEPLETPIGAPFFFQLECDAPRWTDRFEKKHLLPQLGRLFGEEAFTEVSLAWSETGLHFFVEVQDAEQGEGGAGENSVELFIDTKNVKNARTTPRFCHHFLITPERISGVQSKEITRFRTEDKHALSLPDELDVKTKINSSGYTLEITIPERCLTGYQPEVGGSIGFQYRIHRSKKSSQHFGISTNNCNFELYPYLWNSVKLAK